MNTACCDDFESACPKVDNEVCSSLSNELHGVFILTINNDLKIKDDLPVIKFCPWCGESISGFLCTGTGKNGHRKPCCDRAGEYNGFGSGEIIFHCPEICTCHD